MYNIYVTLHVNKSKKKTFELVSNEPSEIYELVRVSADLDNQSIPVMTLIS